MREMVEAMSKLPDDAVFRWYQDSYAAPDGSIQPADTMCVTMGQARAELGIASGGDVAQAR
jgi:hypothetical protein